MFARGRSRERMYVESLQEQDVRLLGDGALRDMLSRTFWRTVDASCRVQLENEFYEIAEAPADLMGERALVRRDGDGEVYVMHPRRREWLETRDFRPVMVGNYRSYKDDVNAGLSKVGKELPAIGHRDMDHGSTEEADRLEACPTNTRSFPTIRNKNPCYP